MTITISAAISKEIKGTWGPELFHDKVGLPVIKTNNLNYDGTIDLSNVSFRDIEPSSLAQLGLVPGDLLIEKSGGTKTHSVGYVAFFDGPANTYVANNFILTIRPNPSVVLPRFLFHQLRYKYESGQFADCYNKTTGIQNLKTKAYLSKYISLPTMERQVFISNELDLITREINDSKEQIKLLDEQAKSLFNEMFASLPKTPLSEFCTLITDGTHQPPKFVESGIPFIFVSNIAEDYLSLNAEKFISEETWSSLSKHAPVSFGDILISTVGSYGHPALVNTTEKFSFQRHIALIKPNRNKLLGEYLWAAILSDDVQRQIDESVKGVAQKTLNLGALKKIVIPNASIEGQTCFAKKLSCIDKLRFNYQKQIDLLNELMEKKMEEYFGGEEDA